MNFVVGILALGILLAAPALAETGRTIENNAYRLSISIDGNDVSAILEDKQSGLRLADGPMVFRTDPTGHENPTNLSQLVNPSIKVTGDRLQITGILAGLQFKQTFVLPADKSAMDETLELTNRTGKMVSLQDFECGFTRLLQSADGATPDDILTDRWVAVPHRKRAEDPADKFNDFSAADLANKPGYEAHPTPAPSPDYRPSRHRNSDGWAWVHGAYALGIYKYSQKAMLFSVLSVANKQGGKLLRFGGTAMIMHEPAILSRLKPGETADLGLTHYQTFIGGYREAMVGFRRFLDDRGCRFPANYNPPVHWEQLYDMEGAWDHRAEQYTKAIIEREAQKGVEYSCEAIYLDPGWDTKFASLIWGEQWLGPARAFINEMRDKFGLKVALHCPMATWMSSGPMGPPAVDTYPDAARIIPPPQEDIPDLKVPASRGGRRNLALLPSAKASASSWLPGYQIHQVAHMNDGWYGNSQSWICGKMPAWAQIDLGAEYTISSVVVGNDHQGVFSDRSATEMRVLVATGDSEWKPVAEYSGPALKIEHAFNFPATTVDKVRIEIDKAEDPKDMPRFDEVEIYEDRISTPAELASYENSVKRGELLPSAMGRPAMCQGSKQYLAVAEKRLLDLCADGVAFLMFDGTWWNGGCVNPAHGHPIPYTKEDHIRAHVGLAQSIHAKYPKVLIEMHDMIAGGSPVRLTPIYYTYGLPRSWDENWGYELMWDSMGNIKSLQCLSLYYYNLTCNIPFYLHINLRDDNTDCIVLWWYASTCRHLGIGGTSRNGEVVAAQKRAMKRYHSMEDLYKRGEFYGVNEEVHVHVLGNRIAVNVFNLTDGARTAKGAIPLNELGLDPARSYIFDKKWVKCVNGQLIISANMGPWGADMSGGKSK